MMLWHLACGASALRLSPPKQANVLSTQHQQDSSQSFKASGQLWVHVVCARLRLLDAWKQFLRSSNTLDIESGTCPASSAIPHPLSYKATSNDW